MLTIQRLTGDESRIDIACINELLIQQSPNLKKGVTEAEVRRVLRDPRFYLFVAFDSERPDDGYLGMASVVFGRTVNKWIGEIHDVVVDSQSRGQGIGRALVQRLIDLAGQLSANWDAKMDLCLTSRPSRIEANTLYAKLGFVLTAQAAGEQGTNFYRMNIGPGGKGGAVKPPLSCPFCGMMQVKNRLIPSL